MNPVKALLSVFRKKHGTSIDVPSNAFRFLGEPTGEVQVLKDVLREALDRDPGFKKAYLTQVRYSDDQKVRLALCIDTESSRREVVGPLSEHCAKYISSIDIFYFSDLGQHHIDQLKSVVEPFLVGCVKPGL